MTTRPLQLTVLSLLGGALLTACSDQASQPSGSVLDGAGGAGGGSAVRPEGCEALGNPLAEGTAPAQRGDMAFAVDPKCGRSFMFFGDNAVPVMCNPAASSFLSDGYVYDAFDGRWAELSVGGDALPLARARGRAVWDEKGSRLILFGGRHRQGTTGPYTFFNDVWAFDPLAMSWQQLSPQDAPGAPTGRMNMSLSADPDNDRIVVHGGGTTDLSSYAVNDETWAFDLASLSWRQLATSGPRPPARLFHVAALDQNQGRLYVFGGAGADALFATSFMRDLWYLDFAEDRWTALSEAVGPSGRIKGEMAYDSQRAQLLLFGGHDDTALGNSNDLWRFDLENAAWQLIAQGDSFQRPALAVCDFPADFAKIDPNSPERRESHLFTLSGDRALLYGGRTDCGLAKDTWELDLQSLTWAEKNSSPVGMTCHRSGSLDCDKAEARLCL